MKRNNFETTIRVKRIDIINLMNACGVVESITNDKQKWRILKESLKAQLENLDRQLDEVINEISKDEY